MNDKKLPKGEKGCSDTEVEQKINELYKSSKKFEKFYQTSCYNLKFINIFVKSIKSYNLFNQILSFFPLPLTFRITLKVFGLSCKCRCFGSEVYVFDK